MLSNNNCERYERWKKQQKLLSNLKKQNTKRPRKEITDCIEEKKRTVPKSVIKIRYRKCKKGVKTEDKKLKGVIFKPKLVSSIDTLLKRIQPSLEVRYKFVDARHFDCYIEKTPEIDLIALKKIMNKIQQENKRTAKRDLKIKRKTIKRKKTISKEEKAVELEVDSEDKDATADVEKEDALAEEMKEKEDQDDENKVQRKKALKKDKFWCKKVKKKLESISEDSECESVCSFDSDIYVKGLALTLEDKKKIKENRKRVQTSSNA